jgi:hypothetical protein
MALILKRKKELEVLALGEMRRDPHCADLEEVSIETDQYGVWFIAPSDPTARFSTEIQRAAVNAQIALRPKYGLAAD